MTKWKVDELKNPAAHLPGNTPFLVAGKVSVAAR
jgi:hypothetical protein